MKVLVIGAGNMGKTYMRSFLASRFIEPSGIYVLSRTIESASSVKEIPLDNLNIVPGDYISLADIVILAVKPGHCNLGSKAPRLHAVGSSNKTIYLRRAVGTFYNGRN